MCECGAGFRIEGEATRDTLLGLFWPVTTPGTGFVQAPLDGLVATFGNDTYARIFQPFSPVRLFSPVGSNQTEVDFFVPGSQGTIPATTTGFAAVFTDVERPNGSGPLGRIGNLRASTLIYGEPKAIE
jgi:hypothetical protein